MRRDTRWCTHTCSRRTWTGLSFPESGQYVVAGALNPVIIDRERDEGVLTEPNVWVVHAAA